MREILFRGKCGIGNVWVCGYYTRRDNDGDIEHHIEGISRVSFRMIPETLGQWTGLKDKAGTRIFEGDIVETSKYGYENGNGPNYNGKDRFVVHFSDGTYVLENKRRRFCLIPDIGAEVIGNIHDNPELLEVAE